MIYSIFRHGTATSDVPAHSEGFFFFLILLGLVPAEQVPSQEEEGNISF